MDYTNCLNYFRNYSNYLNINLEKEYRNQIIEKFKHLQSVKSRDFPVKLHGTLLRDLLIKRCNENVNARDIDVLKLHFNLKGKNKEIVDKIGNIPAGKFRQIPPFLKNETPKPSVKTVEISAILVDYNPRPFGAYKYEKNKKSLSEKVDEPLVTEVENINQVLKEQDVLIDDTLKKTKDATLNKNITEAVSDKFALNTLNATLKKKVVLSLIGVGLLAIFCYSIYAYFTKKCYAWINDHYEVFDCNAEFLDQKGVTFIKNIEKVNIATFRRILPNSKTNFYNKQNQPTIWYANNSSGNPEFFTAKGKHPVTNETLKPVPKTLVATYKHTPKKEDTAAIVEKPYDDLSVTKKTDTGSEKIKNVLNSANIPAYINVSVTQTKKNDVSLLAFANGEIDTAFLPVLFSKVTSDTNNVTRFIISEKLTPSEIATFSNGDISALKDVKRVVDEFWIFNTSYTYKSSSLKPNWWVCNAMVNGIKISAVTGKQEKIEIPMTTIGTGASKVAAKLHALNKLTL